jgi:methylenetetrahydrofolate dehydrogenase (NADP+) / methenyltetrahydrofolate cyclohydrolase
MTASLLDGKFVAGELKKKIITAVTEHTSHGLRPPGLAVILLGDNPASMIYVNNKRKTCIDVGFHSYAYDLPQQTTERELLSLIDDLNNDSNVDGILVQLPLPPHINTTTIIERINPQKDVDGFHPYNLGRLAQGNPLLRPCTPYGIMQLLRHYQLDVQGKNAVIIGASNIVGRPMALELLLAKATVTICHSATQHIERHVRAAELLVIATGHYDVIKTDWLHDKQIIIDVGIHRNKEGIIHGDIDFKEATTKVKWITPVPGGIGPMTIVTLLQNTLTAAGY